MKKRISRPGLHIHMLLIRFLPSGNARKVYKPIHIIGEKHNKAYIDRDV